MDDAITLYAHPEADGAIEYAPCMLIVSNSLDATVTTVSIGPAGLRDLSARLQSLADLIELGGA